MYLVYMNSIHMAHMTDINPVYIDGCCSTINFNTCQQHHKANKMVPGQALNTVLWYNSIFCDRCQGMTLPNWSVTYSSKPVDGPGRVTVLQVPQI